MTHPYDRFTDLLRAIYDRRLSGPPVLRADDAFPGQQRFLAAWPGLRDEALRVAGAIGHVPRFHELMAAQADISSNDARDWRMFVLKAYGVPIPENLARCPQLRDLLAETPEVLSAAFSFLAPHKHIPEHRGPFRGVLRYYLGLSVPADSLGRPETELIIDGHSYRIGNGEGLLWDDTFRHEVRHHSERWRIALLLDVRRIGLPADLAVLTRVLTATAAAAVRVQRALHPGHFGVR